MLRTTPVRLLTEHDRADVLALLRRDPVANVFVQSRVETAGIEPWRLGAELWGYAPNGKLTGLCYSGANFVPASCDAAAIRAMADRARRQGRRCSSIVGPSSMVGSLWRHVAPVWGPAREVRPDQPLMVARERDPSVRPDPGVRVVTTDEVDTLLPACVAMFTEEVGISPTAGDGGALYRARVNEIVSSGRSFARIEDGRVIFKAEIGAATAEVCQVQGVWVDPALRGRGLGIAGMAAVVELALQRVAPLVSLYVNDFNVAARRAYERVGFRTVGSFTSVLF